VKYTVTYRGGEVSAEIEADSSEQAWQKFRYGECEYEVNVYSFHPDFIQVEDE